MIRKSKPTKKRFSLSVVQASDFGIRSKRICCPGKQSKRGYGGAKFSDLAVYTPRIVAAHHPKAVVIFVANDITGNSMSDKSSEEIVQLLDSIIKDIRRHTEPSEIFVVAITPTPSRFKVWSQIDQANHAMEQYCRSSQRVHFIKTKDAYFNEKGCHALSFSKKTNSTKIRRAIKFGVD